MSDIQDQVPDEKRCMISAATVGSVFLFQKNAPQSLCSTFGVHFNLTAFFC
jgi:hypothetical protein